MPCEAERAVAELAPGQSLTTTILIYICPKIFRSGSAPASEETPRKGLWLSALDLVLANRGHTPTVYVYSSGEVATAGDFFNVARLKESMAKALVAFYPLAGRLGVDPDGRIEINCNGEGAHFVVAHCDHLTVDFTDPKPSPELRRLFVRRIEPSSIMMAIQVTFLKCGGVVLGTALHHVVIDASSAFHFFQTWASYCRDGDSAVTELPCHDRTLLRARSPPVIHPETISMFCRKLAMQEPSAGFSVATEVFTISKEQLFALKRRRQHLLRRERARVAVRLRRPAARPGGPDAHEFPGEHQAPPPAPAPRALLRQRRRQRVRHRHGEGRGVGYAGRRRWPDQRHDGAARRRAAEVGGGLLRDVGEGRAARGQGEPAGDGAAVNSWFRMPMYDADFGWGEPRVMTWAEAVRGGWVYLLSGCGDGSARVLISLEAANLKKFERLMYAKF